MNTKHREVEDEEQEFNRLCTTEIELGGFKRANGTMDSYEQAIWLRKAITQAKEEERNRIVDVCWRFCGTDPSDELEKALCEEDDRIDDLSPKDHSPDAIRRVVEKYGECLKKLGST